MEISLEVDSQRNLIFNRQLNGPISALHRALSREWGFWVSWCSAPPRHDLTGRGDTCVKEQKQNHGPAEVSKLVINEAVPTDSRRECVCDRKRHITQLFGKATNLCVCVLYRQHNPQARVKHTVKRHCFRSVLPNVAPEGRVWSSLLLLFQSGFQPRLGRSGVWIY